MSHELYFSALLHEKAEQYFEAARPCFGQREREILSKLEQCSENQKVCMKYLYGTMPTSDIINYDFELFLSYVDHALFLRENTPWCSTIPEDIFLNHVLYYRVNTEDIVDCRRTFYDLCWPRLQKTGKTTNMKDAALELNYWCFENATYRLTDNRTANPLTVLRCAYGRCGEESTFATTAFRSMGIPTRQIYTPRWPHCDDNHAWIEVWCDGDWHYLGACEPEEVLDKGWFTAAASRAMIIHSRMFSDYVENEEIVTHEGLTTVCNELPRYADTQTFSIQVLDNGKPVEGVTLRIELLNYSEFFPISTLVSDREGKASITLGLGDLHIHAVKDGKFMTRLVDSRKESSVVLDFSAASAEQTEERNGLEYDVVPPKDNMKFAVRLTDEQKETQQRKFDAAASLLHQKEGTFYNEESAAKAAAKLGLTNSAAEYAAKALFDAKGNSGEVESFLSVACAQEQELRAKLLHVLTVKDMTDLCASVLEQHMAQAPAQGELPEELYIPYVLSPRISTEKLTAWRAPLAASFTGEEKQSFAANPEALWDWILEHISSCDEREYSSLVAVPDRILRVGIGTNLSKQVLFVAVCRTLGIPARINPETHAVQFYRDGVFHNVEKANKARTLPFTVVSGDETKWVYFQNWSIALLRDGIYTTLDLSEREWQDGKLALELTPGSYRLLTAKRMPNGSLFTKEYRFPVGEGLSDSVTIRLRDTKISDMLENMDILPFSLKDENGNRIAAEELTAGRANILFWLEEGKEPTEHILNELIEHQARYNALDAQLVFILRGKEALNNHTLAKALGLLPKVTICYDDFRGNVSAIARRMYVDPDKLPLIVVTKPGLNGIFATSGYNVGMGDLLIKILAE